MSLVAGTRLGPYEIQCAIGAGGMGEVYKARDSRLERDVALKVLPAQALGDPTARARLLREARLASRLNHPHICTIYEVGEIEAPPDSASSTGPGSSGSLVASAGGVAYIAMELVEGEPLSARVADGPLRIEQVVRYGEQLADALAHAHGRGVVHRDLKSANVVVTSEGQVKVLDFGLAKRLASGEPAEATTVLGQSLTAPGTVAGTLAYMAPEQLRGQPADARSDIWALGIVLYEMAAGRRPFQGQTGFELTAAILNQPVPALPGPVRSTLGGVVERCLAKDPGARYQGGSEVKAALEALASGRGTARSPRWRTTAWRPRRLLGGTAAVLALLIAVVALFVLDLGGVRSRLTRRTSTIRLAVLPFANLSGDAQQEYVTDGLTQEMITQLGRLHPTSLSVIGRTSVMRYKKKDTPIDQIGRELGVDYVLEGSARRQADRIRIAAELIKVGEQTQVWADTYERDLAAILTVQGHVAQSVAKALAVELLPAEQARLAIVRTINPEAYESYLKGTSLWQTLELADLDPAQRHFEQALEKDPSYAPAYSGLAFVWLVRQQFGFAPSSETGPKAKAAALRAVALDDQSAEAHEALASVLTWSEWNWAAAEREWKRALQLNPNAANAQAYYAHYLALMGRAVEGLSHSDLAVKLDPFNPLYHGLRGLVLVYLRRYDDALAAARAAISIRTDTRIAYSVIQVVYLCKGMRSEQLADQRLRIARDPERVAAFERGLAEGGYEGAQRAIADVLAARYEKGQYHSGVGVAMRYLDAGDKDRAIAWLYKAYDNREQELPYIGWPDMDPLRPDPRYQALLRRVGLPQ
jgi:serine/threonine-protein kinase